MKVVQYSAEAESTILDQNINIKKMFNSYINCMVTLAIPIAKISTYGKSKSIGTLPHGYHFLKCQLAKTEFSVAMIMFFLLREGVKTPSPGKFP